MQLAIALIGLATALIPLAGSIYQIAPAAGRAQAPETAAGGLAVRRRGDDRGAELPDGVRHRPEIRAGAAAGRDLLPARRGEDPAAAHRRGAPEQGDPSWPDDLARLPERAGRPVHRAGGQMRRDRAAAGLWAVFRWGERQGRVRVPPLRRDGRRGGDRSAQRRSRRCRPGVRHEHELPPSAGRTRIIDETRRVALG